MKASASRAQPPGDQVDFGERRGARERLVLDALGQPHVLGPGIDLRAEDVRAPRPARVRAAPARRRRRPRATRPPAGPGGSRGESLCRWSRYRIGDGAITTSWPARAAAIAPCGAAPGHDGSRARGMPLSRISSQPISRRPRASRKRPMRAMNQPCSAASSASPSSRMRACTRGDACQRSLTASSPPTWMYSPGNSSMTSASTFSRKASVGSSALKR